MKIKVNLNDGVQFIFKHIGGREFQEVLNNFLGTNEDFMMLHKDKITGIQIEKEIK